MKILGRQPAQWLALLAMFLQLGAAWGLELSEIQQGAINAAATAVFGFALAWTAARERAAAAAGGLVGAAGQLAVVFGADFSQEQIGMTAAFITAGLAFWLYGKITAPITPDGTRVPKEPLTLRR
ncbi:hypothetical protein ACFHW2_11740 [Actinomadura sp. LOL_016]|uniref:hypothetical protein n=1 Tax=unclassified Actinomadura TaxID=2626254 RepID=UPI003A810D34